MSTTVLKFPSGRSVARCKKDAKELVKSAKLNGESLSHSQALDIVAQQNGSPKGWSKSLAELEKPVLHPSVREAQSHLMGHAVNKLIEQGCIDLHSTEDAENGSLECKLLGRNSVVTWQYIGFGEVRISVWWNFNKRKHPQHLEGGFSGKRPLSEANNGSRSDKMVGYVRDSSIESYSGYRPLAARSKYKEFVGVVFSTWLERKTGRYLQLNDGHGVIMSYVRQADKEALLAIPKCNPQGFDLKGKFWS